MPAFYRASVAGFITTPESELTGRLTSAYANAGYSEQKTSQTRTWIADILNLQHHLAAVLVKNSKVGHWTLLLEFSIPRKEKRIDVVILTAASIIILELKSAIVASTSIRQIEEYALLLHYFHQPSANRRIVPFLVSPHAPNPYSRILTNRGQQFLPLVEAPGYWIQPVALLSWSQLPEALLALKDLPSAQTIDPAAWDDGEYRPVPTIIDAALSLQAGLDVREIAHSRAARHDIDRLAQFIRNHITQARNQHEFVICFVTGVPGSGKTLVGLNLAFGTKSGDDPIHFMSGTGPLVKVLQAALAADHRGRMKVSSEEARMKAKTLIENVHVFARYYAEENPDRPPSNHIIIFDEAQRAWDRKQNLAKFKRPYSEPEMLIEIMERHADWGFVIALVGGGQEINNGEAGLEEWGTTLEKAKKAWKILASPEAVFGGTAVAGSKLLASVKDASLEVHPHQELHLDVCVRNLKAASYATWVNHVLLGEQEAASALNIQDHFPVLLTRSLTDLRALLRENTLGERRAGLVASSGAVRLRAEGLESDSTFHAEYPWHHWYLAERTDVRSSHQLEVFATEFEIQGLELDWIGLCWGGDYIWSAETKRWIARMLSHKKQTSWSTIKQAQKQIFRRNAYRVLLTRARMGLVIFVPQGDRNDPTRTPEDFDATCAFLHGCGVREAKRLSQDAFDQPQQAALFRSSPL
jgi:hypothetical protein